MLPFYNNKRLYTIAAALTAAYTLRVVYKHAIFAPTTSVDCYLTEKESENALPSAEDIIPRPDSIFFHETSCAGNMNSRQACAVESAARLHPNRDIYVYFNAPVKKAGLNYSCLSILTKFKNIKLVRLHVVKYGNGTVLGGMLASTKYSQSYWPVEHTSDILRFVTLHKYGGIYLNTDIIVVKSLDGLGKNWVARQNEIELNNAAMAFSSEIGRNLTTIILNDVKENYYPEKWSYNGGGALQRALTKFCNTTDPVEMSAAKCQGFEVFDPRFFYIVPWTATDIYFQEGKIPYYIAVDKDKIYAFYLWNNMSKGKTIENGSPLQRIARKWCPSTKKAYGNKFGS